MILIAFGIYVKHERSSPDLQLYRLVQLLSDLGVEMDLRRGFMPQQSWWGDISQFLVFIRPRILTGFGPNFHLTHSHYTDFAVRCAKLAPKKVW
jgi:hypothetical protein